MENYGKATQLATDATNSGGKAMEKYNVYQESIAASQERIKAYWQEWVQNVDVQSIIKDLLSISEGFMKIFSNSMIVNIGKTVLALVSFYRIFKMIVQAAATGGISSVANFGELLSMGAGGAFGGIGAILVAMTALMLLFDKFHKSTSELKSELSGLNSEIEQNQETIDSYTQQISDNLNQIQSIRNSGNSNPIQEDTINNLKEENEELERNIELLKQQNKEKERQAEKDAKDLIKKNSNTQFTYGEYAVKYDENGNFAKDTSVAFNDIIKGYQSEIDVVTKKMNDLESAGGSNTGAYKSLKKLLDSDKDALTDFVTNAQSILSALPEGKEKEELQKMLDEYYDAIETTKEKVDNLISDKSNSQTVGYLQTLATDGELTADVINKLSFDPFIMAMQKLGFTVQDIIDYFYGLSNAADDTASNVNKISSGTMLSNIGDKVTAVKDAEAELNKTGYLTVDTVKSLTSPGLDLGDSLTVTDKGYKTTKTSLEGLLTAQKQEYVNSVTNARTAAAALIGYKASETAAYDEVTNAIIAKLTAQIAEQEAAISHGNNSALAIGQYKSLVQGKTNLDNALGNLKTYNTTASYLGNKSLSDYNSKNKSSNSSSSSSKTETDYEKDIRILEQRVFLAKQFAEVYKDSDSEKYQGKVKEEANVYTQLMNRVHKQAQDLRKKGYKDTSEEIQKLQQSYWGYYNDRKDLMDDLADYNKQKEEEIKEQTETAISDVKDAISDILDDLSDNLSKQQKEYDNQITKLQAIQTLTSDYYDITNDVNSEIKSINDELETSKKTYEYLDDSLRDTLFNDDDYENLASKLQKIADESKSLYENYLDDLNELYDADIYIAQEITYEVESKYNYKKLEYEAASAELDLVKAQTKLQNVLSNRNVRMYKNGQWIWTYSHEDAESAMDDVSSAESDYETAQVKVKQQAVIDEYSKMISTVQAQSDSAQAQYDEISEQWENIESQLTTEEDSMTKLLSTLNDTNIPAFQKIIDSVGSSFVSLLNSIGVNTSGISATTTSSGASSSSSKLLSTDWSSVADTATTLDELQDALEKRSAKATALGIDISGDTSGYRSNSEIYKEVSSKLGYDSGGVLEGMGGIKATKDDETVFDSSISSKLLSPTKSKEFLNSANAIVKLLDNSSGINTLFSKLGNIVSGGSSSSDSHDTNVNGIKLSTSDSQNINNILRRYIPITKG